MLIRIRVPGPAAASRIRLMQRSPQSSRNPGSETSRPEILRAVCPYQSTALSTSHFSEICLAGIERRDLPYPAQNTRTISGSSCLPCEPERGYTRPNRHRVNFPESYPLARASSLHEISFQTTSNADWPESPCARQAILRERSATDPMCVPVDSQHPEFRTFSPGLQRTPQTDAGIPSAGEPDRPAIDGRCSQGFRN